MKLSQGLCFITLALLLISPHPANSQTSRSRSAQRGNAQIVRVLREIDARNVESTIRKLVSFGTRNTLSVQNDPNRGIGAARDWLYEEFL